MKKYVKAQIKRIEIDKWLEGIKVNKDPGQPYIFTWIGSNAPEFRKSWENSLCKKCCMSEKCGHLVLDNCDRFVGEPEK